MTAQLYAFLNGEGELCVELPAINVSRRKIEDLSPETRAELRAILRDEQDRLREIERKKTRELTTENIKRALVHGAQQGEFLIPEPKQLSSGGIGTVLVAQQTMTPSWAKNIWGDKAVDRVAKLNWENAQKRLAAREKASSKSKADKPIMVEVEDL